MRAASIDARTTTLAAILAPGANSFGVIRLAMAVAVLFSHSFWFVTGSSANEPLHAITGFSLGEHAVQVFFLLSGVLVAQSFDKSRSVIDFAIARTLRIFPGLFVCVIATALALGLVVTVLTPQDFIAHPGLKTYLAKTLTLVSGSASLPGVFETLPVPGLFNGSLWTLKYEVICYAGLAALGALSLFEPRLRVLSIALIAVFAAGCAALIPADPANFSPAQNIAYFAIYFATGVFAYLIRERLVIHWMASALLLALAAFSIGKPWQNIATAVALGYATLFFGSLTYGRLTKWTRAHDLSFGIYIYAAPIQQTLIQLHPGIDPYTVSAAALLIALPCAHVSWTWIEAPALSWRRPLVSMFRPARQPVAPEPERLPANEIAAAAPPIPPARFTGPDLNRRLGRAAPLARHARGSLRVPPAQSAARYRG